MTKEEDEQKRQDCPECRCESIREQRLGVGFYDPLRKSNPALYWPREHEYSNQRHRSENMAGMIISVVVGVSLFFAVGLGIFHLIAKAMNLE